MNDIKLINGSYYLYSDGTWSLIKNPTNRLRYLASLDENKRLFLLLHPEADSKGLQLDYEENAANTAKSKLTARLLIGTGLQLGGGIVGTMFAPLLFVPIWAGEGARNMMSDNGVKKTVLLAKGIDPDDSDVLQKLQKLNSKEGLAGKAIMSGLGDALDASMAFGPILSNASNIAKAIPMIKKVEGSNFLSKLNNAAKINLELDKLAENLGSKKVNPVLQASLPDNTISYQQVFRPSAKTILFGERPSKLTEAERLGIPKGERPEADPIILENAKAFAKKYGYEEPLNIELAKLMYRLHNSFFRTVDDIQATSWLDNPLFKENEAVLYLKSLPIEERTKVLASKGYPAAFRTFHPEDKGFLDMTVFASPSLDANSAYHDGDLSFTVLLQRPFSFRDPNKWHINADWRPQYDFVDNTAPVQIGNAHPRHEVKLSTNHLIPVKMAESGDKGTLVGEYLRPYPVEDAYDNYTDFTKIKKQGGTINYLNCFK